MLIISGMVAPSARANDALTAAEQKVVQAVDARIEEQIAFLEKVVNINSDTLNLAGVREVGDVMGQAYKEIGFDVQWVDLPTAMHRAGHLVVKHEGNSPKRILLLGHLDTVFPKDGDFQTFERFGNQAKGPGLSDMKSGNVIMLFALKALKDAGLLDDVNVVALYTGDEEKVGKPFQVSRQAMVDLAKASDAALSFEGGRPDTAVVARRGSSGWRLSVTGTRAHSSAIFRDQVGAGAIFEMSRILNSFYEDVRGEDYLTFNPGILVGGTKIDADWQQSTASVFGKTNVVAQTAEVAGGLRFISEEQKERTREKMRKIVADNLPGTSAEITFTDSYPAMPPTPGNYALLDVLSGVNVALGLGEVKANDPGSRGAGDVSFVAPYVSGIDGLGGSGRGGHTFDEELDLRSLAPMTKRAALLIYRLAHGAAEK